MAHRFTHFFPIFSSQPAVLDDLRRWTSSEALGDITVPPDCALRILQDHIHDDAVDHKLPSPEEQVQAVALKYVFEHFTCHFNKISVQRIILINAWRFCDNDIDSQQK